MTTSLEKGKVSVDREQLAKRPLPSPHADSKRSAQMIFVRHIYDFLALLLVVRSY